MEFITLINKEALDENRYFISLMNVAAQKGLLQMDLLKNSSLELNDILKEVVYRYTKGQSSTLKTEVVEGLMKSMVYALDLLLIQFPTPEEAIAHLKNNNMKSLYDEAIINLKAYTVDTKQLYKDIEAKRLFIPNVVYEESFAQAIPNFLSSYDVYFSAQETTCDIDYPLTIDHGSATGIIYIRKYLETFEAENEFCLKFNPLDIHKLLKAYGKANRISFKETPINIFELVFNNAIFATLLGMDYENLILSSIEFELLEDKLSGLNKPHIHDLLLKALDVMTLNLEIHNPKLENLMRRYTISLIERLDIALKNGNLANLLVREANITPKDATTLEVGKKMGNRDFRVVYNKIMNCVTVEDKMAILTTYVSSLDDFIDLLKADCFFGEEYSYVFDGLGDLELSALICNGLKEYIIGEKDVLNNLFSTNIDYQFDWEEAFVEYLEKLDNSRIKDIEILVDKSLQSRIV